MTMKRMDTYGTEIRGSQRDKERERHDGRGEVNRKVNVVGSPGLGRDKSGYPD